MSDSNDVPTHMAKVGYNGHLGKKWKRMTKKLTHIYTFVFVVCLTVIPQDKVSTTQVV